MSRYNERPAKADKAFRTWAARAFEGGLEIIDGSAQILLKKNVSRGRWPSSTIRKFSAPDLSFGGVRRSDGKEVSRLGVKEFVNKKPILVPDIPAQVA
jgi:hypothetical protein